MTPQLIRMTVLMLVLGGVSALGLLRVDQGTPVTFAGGALLLSAIFAGRLAGTVGLPKLTGYLLIGILVGPYVLRFISTDAVTGLDLVRGLAVSLIALMAGTELQLGLIRRVGLKVTVMCLIVSAVVFVSVGVAVVALKPFLGFLEGTGSSQDAHHLTAPTPDGSGASRAVLQALADAGIAAEDVDYVNAHGTGTPLNDRSETGAMRIALGDHLSKTPISSLKSAIGHSLGAAGAIEAVATTIRGKLGRTDWGDDRVFLDAYYAALRAELEGKLLMGQRKADKFDTVA